MSTETKISWTDKTWNPVTGCSRVSPGCENCYAARQAPRLAAMGTPGYTNLPWTAPNAAENVVLHHRRINEPHRWRKPRRVFVNSMSDLFHEDVPDGFIAWVWLTMAKTPHTYQILTKRPERMRDFVLRWNDHTGEDFSDFKGVRGPQATREAHPSGRGQLFAAYLEELGKTSGGDPPPGAAWPTFDWMEGPMRWPYFPLYNVWLGVSVEDQRRADERIPLLLETPAAVRFLSCEPLLEPLLLTPWLGEEVEILHDGLRHYTQPTGSKVLVESAGIMLRGNAPGYTMHAYGKSPIKWVIAGGESGPGFRACDLGWLRGLRDQCAAAGVAFWCKQPAGPRSEGALPEDLRVREFPS